VAVAFTPISLRVPAVLEQDVPDVNDVALPHASLPGCAIEKKGNNKKINDLFIMLRQVRVFMEMGINGSN
jgi:hypothetical protein